MTVILYVRPVFFFLGGGIAKNIPLDALFLKSDVDVVKDWRGKCRGAMIEIVLLQVNLW